MWFNLAASRLPPGKQRDAAIESRDLTAKRLSPEKLLEAQRRAREWKPGKP
jgi:hypothetical protein